MPTKQNKKHTKIYILYFICKYTVKQFPPGNNNVVWILNWTQAVVSLLGTSSPTNQLCVTERHRAKVSLIWFKVCLCETEPCCCYGSVCLSYLLHNESWMRKSFPTTPFSDFFYTNTFDQRCKGRFGKSHGAFLDRTFVFPCNWKFLQLHILSASSTI